MLLVVGFSQLVLLINTIGLELNLALVGRAVVTVRLILNLRCLDVSYKFWDCLLLILEVLIHILIVFIFGALHLNERLVEVDHLRHYRGLDATLELEHRRLVSLGMKHCLLYLVLILNLHGCLVQVLGNEHTLVHQRLVAGHHHC